MALRKYFILLIFMLYTLTATAQGKLLFAPSEWNFGTIREADGRVTHIFSGQNTGNKPVVILDVTTTCGCTAPEFSKQPILPGAKAQIKVTFDPANRPGTFAKDLVVYSVERQKIATLTVRGSVVARKKTPEELYPVHVGGGLRLTENMCAFTYVYQGRQVQSSIGFLNTSNRTVTLTLRPETSTGLLTLGYPRTIAPGQRGELNFSYLIPAEKPRYGTLNDTFAIQVDGKTSETALLVHGIGVDSPASVTLSRAPKAEIEKNIVKFGAVKHSASLRKEPLMILNQGTAALIVRAVEISGNFSTSLREGARIPAGGSATYEINLDPSQQDYGTLTGQMMIVTNDPSRPMRRVRLTAVIEN